MKKNKRVKLIVLIIALSLVVVGCGKNEPPKTDDNIVNDPAIGDEVVEPIEMDIDDELIDEGDKYGAFIMMIDDNTYEYDLIAKDDEVFQIGMPYTIYKFNSESEWEELELDLMFTLQLIIVDSENPFTQMVDVSILEAGLYKIDKVVFNGDGEVIEGFGHAYFEVFERSK